MKFQLSFKTPDVVDQLTFSDDNEKMLVQEFLKKWVEFGENITVEFDSVRGTAKVIPVLS